MSFCWMRILWVVIASGMVLAGCAPARVTVRNQTVNEISPLLFGQMMEIAKSEPGPNGALLPDQTDFRPDVKQKLLALRPTIIRYPGGARVEFSNYRMFLPRLPEGPLPEKVQGESPFDLLDFLTFCENGGIEPLICVQFRGAFWRHSTLQKDSQLAAQLVAFANGDPDDATLRDDLRVWAELRVELGHPEPFDVKYWQIGNEIWVYRDAVAKTLHETEPDLDIDGWQIHCLKTFIARMRAVDPDILLITDAMSDEFSLRLRREIGDDLNYLSEHKYRPWEVDEATRGEQAFDIDDIPAGDVWRLWVATPDIDSQGQSYWKFKQAGAAHGYPLATTEWNWNGFGDTPKQMQSSWARGLGAAGFLHALLRDGDRIKIACQSTLISGKWSIGSVRYDADNPKQPAWYSTTGIATKFYRDHVGRRRLAVETEGIPTYSQPYRLNEIQPAETVAYIDVVATADEDAVYVHLIQRNFTDDLPVEVDLTDLGLDADTAEWIVLEGKRDDGLGAPEHAPFTTERRTSVPMQNGVLRLTVPARSLSVLKVSR